ncbi:hypothetical protein LCGC14_1569990 [marine sediment metagenome]|uniref:Uncharacterized protein n=1 Tax=marine sediment metagenome TaxID=412755 RepID=A0A0F9LKE0_9ZZZZ
MERRRMLLNCGKYNIGSGLGADITHYPGLWEVKVKFFRWFAYLMVKTDK